MSHPYRSLPPDAFWRDAVAGVAPEQVDPVGTPKFTLARSDRIATAGSCFAQHIAKHLRLNGYQPLITETAHPLIPKALADEYGYGLYTARYGNIYTSRQMLQLLSRSYGQHMPLDHLWLAGDSFIDPFRPAIQPGGFSSRREFEDDRAQHFQAVREAVQTLDCLVFTLGLTECWRDRVDGSVYPICPGVSGGSFNPGRHEFCSLSVADVIADLEGVVAFVLSKNPAARFIFTVSPVPLVATASGRHVLSATTYSKSVLRVAAQHVADRCESVAYFPSYEIITGAYTRGAYFEADLRSVTEKGVAHVMRTFLRHYGSADDTSDRRDATALGGELVPLGDLTKLVCEEEALLAFPSAHNAVQAQADMRSL